ncbi:MAG: glycosyltransferase family 4 protein [bacterium]
MKPVLITLEYPPFYGGIAHYYEHLVRYYPEQIIVVDNQKAELIDQTRSFFKWLPAFKTLKQELKQGANYVLVGHLLPLGTVAWFLSLFNDFKYTVFLHGDDLNFALRTSRKKWLALKILNRADKIITANSYTADQTKKIIDQKQLGKVRVVNPGIDPKIIRHEEQAIKELKDKYNLHGKTILLGIGRLVKRKGYDMAIQALKLAIESNASLIYAIIGQGEEEALIRQQIQDLGLENNVIILGQVDEQTKSLWLKTCDIFIMTARNINDDVEGFGIVYLEANLAGKPVIAGKSGGVADAVEDNVNGLLVNGERVEDISQAILKLSEYESLRQKLGDQGRQRALQNFNWQKQAEKIYDIIHNVK